MSIVCSTVQYSVQSTPTIHNIGKYVNCVFSTFASYMCFQISEEGSGSHEERVLETRDSLRDLFDGKPHGRVRSASQYVVLYPPASSKQQQQQQEYNPMKEVPREGRRR